MTAKKQFKMQLKDFVGELEGHISTDDGQWTIRGFIDVFRNVYTISSDTKIISKILEIHLFPKLMEFAEKYGYKVVLARHQNYYPDISFVKTDDEDLKFAVDFKTTYRNPESRIFAMVSRLALTADILKIARAQKMFNSHTAPIQVISVWGLFTAVQVVRRLTRPEVAR